jgi:hypothetical protein
MSSKKIHSRINLLVKVFQLFVNYVKKHALKAEKEIIENEQRIFNLQKERDALLKAKLRAEGLVKKLEDFIV